MQLAKNSDCDATRSGSVLVVEDHDSFRGIICAALRSYLPGWEVLEADSVSEASALVSSRPIRVIASDFTLSDGTAKDLVDNLSPALSSSPRVVIFSNYTSDDLQPLLTRGEVHAFVPKENGIKALAETIQKESSPAR